MRICSFDFDSMSKASLDNYEWYCFERKEKIKQEKIYYLKPKELENIKGE